MEAVCFSENSFTQHSLLFNVINPHARSFTVSSSNLWGTLPGIPLFGLGKPKHSSSPVSLILWMRKLKPEMGATCPRHAGHLWKSQTGTLGPSAFFHILPEGTASGELPGHEGPAALLLYQFRDREDRDLGTCVFQCFYLGLPFCH